MWETLVDRKNLLLPAAKPSGPEAMRVVPVLVVRGGGAVFSAFYSFYFLVHKFASGWDPVSQFSSY